MVAEHIDFKPRFSSQKAKPKDGVGEDAVHQEIADLAEAALANRIVTEQPELCEAVF